MASSLRMALMVFLVAMLLPEIGLAQNRGRRDRDRRSDRGRYERYDERDRQRDNRHYDNYDGDRYGDKRHARNRHDRRSDRRDRRRVHIPRRYYPPHGMCQVWYPDLSTHHQPRPVPCRRLRSRYPEGALIITHKGHVYRAGHVPYDVYDHHYRRPRARFGVILDF